MSLVNPTPPPAVAEAFSAGLPDFLSGPSFGPAGALTRQKFAGSAPSLPSPADISPDGILRNHDPQPVFILGLNDVVENNGIGAAKAAGWRFFAGDAKFKTVMGRVTRRPPSLQWSLTAAYYGEPVADRDRVWDVLQASHSLVELPEVQTGTFELRILAIPGLNLEVFWLMAHSAGSSDLAVPFPAPPKQPIPELNDSVVLPMTSFLTKIAPLAQFRSSAPDLFGS
jgi:hypothetical protein